MTGYPNEDEGPDEVKWQETKPEHRAIWLQPRCVEESGEDRCWCSDDQGPCDDCGLPSVKYILASDVEAKVNAVPDLVKALEPFALDVGAVSLSKALGHITREHLLAARAVLAKVKP